MKVLDLYSGLGGWSQAFLDRGHSVLRIDNDPQFTRVPGTVIVDALNVNFERHVGEIDVVLASPPCQSFSISSIRWHWKATAPCRCGGTLYRLSGEQWAHKEGSCRQPAPTKNVTLHPRSIQAHIGNSLLQRALDVVKTVQPAYWWMENPRGGMRRMPQVQFLPRCTVWYCRYGHHIAKPTDLWGIWPDTWKPREECHNGNGDHEPAPRGSDRGTQGLANPAERGLIPYELSMEVCLACEAAGL